MSEFAILREIFDVEESEIYEGMPLGAFFIFLGKRFVVMEECVEALDVQFNSIKALETEGRQDTLAYVNKLIISLQNQISKLSERVAELERAPKPTRHVHWLDMTR